MSDARVMLELAKSRSRAGRDAEFDELVALAERIALSDIGETLLLGQTLVRLKLFWRAKRFLAAAQAIFSADFRIPDLLVDICFQVGDAAGALEAYAAATSLGLPAQSEAVRRATRVAVSCGLLDELAALLREPASAPHQAECHAIIARERVAFDRFEERRSRQLGDRLPEVEDILGATQDGDLPYATHLYTHAARSPAIGAQGLLRIAYEAFPPSGDVALILGFISWQLMRAYPADGLCRLETALNGLLQFGDARGAREVLDGVLNGGATFSYPGSADRVVRLATSCAVFGTLPSRRVAEISGALWPNLKLPEFCILAHGFAARSTMRERHGVRPLRTLGEGARPRLALCVSGQLRNFEDSWRMTRAAIAGYDVVVFVSTWDKTGSGLGTGDSIERKLPPAVGRRLPAAFKTRDFFSSRYPYTFDLFSQSDVVSLDRCAAVFDSPHVVVNDEAEFEDAHGGAKDLWNGGNLNQAKMFFGIHQALLAKKRYEDENGMTFDAVVRVRPDLGIRSVGLSDIALASSRDVVLTTHLRFGAVGDVFLIMSSTASDAVAGMWPAMRQAGSFAIVPGASGAAAETALFETLCWQGIDVRQLEDSHVGWLSSVTLDPEILWQRLVVDLRDRDVLDEVDVSVSDAIRQGAGGEPVRSIKELGALVDAKGSSPRQRDRADGTPDRTLTMSEA